MFNNVFIEIQPAWCIESRVLSRQIENLTMCTNRMFKRMGLLRRLGKH